MPPKKILITGGSKGIGLAIARKFYREGFDVMICARGNEGLNQAKSEMPAIKTYACDLADKHQVVQMAEYVNASFGRLDVLVNNGGIFLPGQLHNEPDEVFEQLMAVNLQSAYYLTKRLLPAMIEARTGTIVNMSSVAGIKAYSSGGSYSISKFAMQGFSQSLREELKPYNIRVMTMVPGAVLTASWEGVSLPEERFMPAEDVANLLWTLYSLSDRTVVEQVILRPLLGDI